MTIGYELCPIDIKLIPLLAYSLNLLIQLLFPTLDIHYILQHMPVPQIKRSLRHLIVKHL
jgi:hypothetical protein